MKTAEHIPQMQDRIPANSVMAAVGNTPLIELTRIAAEVAPVRLFAKAEWFNPGGSVKDRPALNMLLDGERRGVLTRDKTILDATSGNTGIAYAMFGAAMGYRVKLCLPSNAGSLHKRILRAYGAQIVETAAAEASDGAIRKAIELYEQSPDEYFYPDQYNNDANWQAHYNTTAVEIWEQTGGAITHFVAGLGTSGTFTGNTRRLREFNPDVQCVSVQPDTPLHALEGWKHMPTSIQPGFYDVKMADQNIEVRTEDAQAMVKRLAAEEGLLVSPSAGAAVVGALTVARELDDGVVVTIMADNASKYLDHMNI
ncbi:cysteine synthase family protein [Planctomycetales bacterium ZRK34]|nr:cysteine synthase family protein [Planctomycetales bacterium ZRK34]